VRTLAFSLCASAYWAMLPLMATCYGAQGYGTILACFGRGALAGAGLLSLMRGRWSIDLMVNCAGAVFAASMFFMVRTRSSLGLFALLAAFAGLAWISSLASLNFVAQTPAPVGVRARMISLYVLALQGGLALGSAVWGVVATHLGLELTLTLAVAALCAGLLLSFRYRLHEARQPDEV